ncbi:MAG: UDP-N-acetylmuramoyl-tripeptide--D-alanyl-D-alanine ligase [Gammaproteobacteria bacterium]|nr:UDP-N-acetylmuramoyl-tripeptide--D-alanyl-D-alanine ligase [Gammaproteobacteria bacterium]
MKPLHMSFLADVTGGKLKGDDALFQSVSTDTRGLRPGELFVALRGPNFDGNAYVEEAARKGAAGALVQKFMPLDLPQVIVTDTRVALGRLARAWRQRFDIPLIAVTGSNGKTTIKEMIASILRQRGPVLATRGNLNNDIGVPLTLFGIDEGSRAAVVEMGANHAGEIDYLATLALPTVGVVSNAGPAHLEGFGSVAGVARAKGELFTALGPAGVAVLNADDEFADMWRGLIGRRQVVSVGIDADADFFAKDIELQGGDGGVATRFRLESRAGQAEITIPFAGVHNVRNALAAAAAAWSAGATLDDIRQGLAATQTVAGRLQLRVAATGATIIDDTYNANPDSLRAALDVQRDLGGEAWLVLGDMGELGAGATGQHAAAGKLARASGVKRLLATGELSAEAVKSFGQGATWYPRAAELIDALRGEVGEGITVLVKASRSMQLEQVVDALVANANGAQRQANGG